MIDQSNLLRYGESVKKSKFDREWEITAMSLMEKDIFGQYIQCPQCGRKGLVFSKWIKKQPVKPLYVFHKIGKDKIEQCFLSEKQCISARSLVSIIEFDIIKILKMGEAYILFSGGKDSLCLLNYINKIAKSIKLEIKALHVDTTAGFPEVETYVKTVCDYLNITLITVRPTYDYFELAKRWGIPGVKSRWCCKTLKIAPLRRFLKTLDTPVIFDGIRSVESNIRSTYLPIWFHPEFRCLSVSPIFYWSNDEVNEFNNANELPVNPYSGLKNSGECWCGAYKSRSDFEDLMKIKPNIFEKLIEVEEAQKGKYTFIYENGERIALSSLKKK